MKQEDEQRKQKEEKGARIARLIFQSCSLFVLHTVVCYVNAYNNVTSLHLVGVYLSLQTIDQTKAILD